MKTEEVERFGAALSDMLRTLSYGKVDPDGKQISQWFRLLEPYPLAAVLAGMAAHMRAPDTPRTLPIPADIIKQINGAVANDGRPGADEAWAIAVQSVDEGATVVWTPEIAEAWGVARHVMDRTIMGRGDEVGARVAFRDAYNRITHAARCERRPMEWIAALGTDKARQVDGLRKAVELGRLPQAALAEAEALPAPREPVTMLTLASPAGAGLAYDADGRRGPTAADLQRIAKVREAIAARRGEYRPSPDAIGKQVTAERRAEVQMQTAAYLAQQPARPAGPERQERPQAPHALPVTHERSPRPI